MLRSRTRLRRWTAAVTVAVAAALTLEIGAFRGIVLVDDLTVQCATR